MSWIEGIGDEVPIFFLLALTVVLVFMVLAWKSTDVPEPSTPQNEDQLRFSVASDSTPEVAADVFPGPSNQPPSSSSSNDAQTVTPSASNSEQPTEQPKQDNNPTENEENTSRDDEKDQEDDTGTKIRRRILETTQAQETILIRLKYLDDTQRTVESSMNTTLGDFKRVNFRAELSANKTVKLIYNGQVLNSELQTLTQLGLDNNCVVHCLIHQLRTSGNTAPGSQETSTPSSPQVNPTQQVPQPQRSNGSGPAEAGVDIGGLLVPLFAVILGLVWYCRIAYATHFTAAATTALVGLSGICILFVFAVWHPTLTVDPSP